MSTKYVTELELSHTRLHTREIHLIICTTYTRIILTGVGCGRTYVYVIRLSQGIVPLGNWHTLSAIFYYSRSTEKNSKPCDSLQSGT